MGVLAQRLVRVLCKDCRTPYLPTPEELKEIGLTPDEVREGSGGMLYKPAGCEQCNQTGYHGRSGIYEMMLMDDEVRALTLKNVDSGTIKRAAVNKGMLTLMDDGRAQVVRGSPASPRSQRHAGRRRLMRCSSTRASPRPARTSAASAMRRAASPAPDPAQGRRVSHDARAAEAGAVAGEEKTGSARVDVGAMLGLTGVSSQDLPSPPGNWRP